MHLGTLANSYFTLGTLVSSPETNVMFEIKMWLRVTGCDKGKSKEDVKSDGCCTCFWTCSS